MASVSAQPPLTRTSLSTPVRRATGRPTLDVVDFHCETLKPGMGEASSGVYHVTGTSHDDATEVPWSLVLKVVAGPQHIGAASLTHFYGDAVFAEPDSLLYWKREVLAYQSGLLDDLPLGLRAPRCYGVEEHGDTDAWIWLEHLRDVSEPQWSLARYGTVAEALGRFNGAYLIGRSLPTAPWVAHDWLRRWVARVAPTFADLPQLLDHRVARHAYPPDVAAGLQQIWDEREVWLRALDRLPQTFCHHDAWRRNLLLVATPDGKEQLATIDWAGLGPGPVGEEIGLLVGVAVLFGNVELADADALVELVLEGYLAGLRGVGWTGDARAVRFGYLATMVLKTRISYLPLSIGAIRDETWYAAYQQESGSTVEQLAETLVPVSDFYLTRAAEVRTLLAHL